MLRELENYGYHTFGYHYLKMQTELPVQIHSFGYEHVDSASYFFDSQNRANHEGNCIFQYTVSGSGVLELDNKSYHLKEGQAFLITIPGKSKYYLPSDSSSWEFLFITFKGQYALDVWKDIITSKGPVIKCSLNDPFMVSLMTHYKEACSKLNDSSSERMGENAFDNSALGYQLIMELQKMLSTTSFSDASAPDTSSFVNDAIQYMNDHLADQVSLEDIATHSHMTKYHFDRMFQKRTGLSPWDYFTKLRIEHAAHLLITTEKTVTEIAPECGYQNVNYFHKVFRKYVGVSATSFRKSYTGNIHFSLEI